MNWKLNLLLLAGYGHFGILIASMQVPRIFDWRNSLQDLHPFVRQLFWVYGVFIVLTIAGLGTLTVLHVRELAAGEPMARSLAAFTAVFWGLRLAVQCFVFDAKPFLTSFWRKLGYHTLTVAFIYFTAVFAWVAIA